MKHILFLFIALVFAISAQGSVLVSGKVLNGSRDSLGVAGIEIVLQKMAAGTNQPGGMQDVDKFSSLSGGSFQFTVPSPDSTTSYFVSADHQGARYYSELVAVEPNSIRVPTQLAVFDSTHDNRAVQTMMHHIFIEDSGESMAVREMRIMQNPLTKTILNAVNDAHEHEAALRFMLPAAAQNVEPIGSHFDELAVHQQYVYYKSILEPGNRQIGYSYNIAWQSNVVVLDLTVSHPTRSLDFFIANPDLVVQADGLTDEGPFTIRNSTFRRYGAQNVGAGQKVQIIFKRQNTAFVAEHPYYAMATTAGLLLLAVIVAFSRKPSVSSAAKNGAPAGKPQQLNKKAGTAYKKGGKRHDR
jgi:hypothetical protein